MTPVATTIISWCCSPSPPGFPPTGRKCWGHYLRHFNADAAVNALLHFTGSTALVGGVQPADPITVDAMIRTSTGRSSALPPGSLWPQVAGVRRGVR